jgi:hypothetical protein
VNFYARIGCVYKQRLEVFNVPFDAKRVMSIRPVSWHPLTHHLRDFHAELPEGTSQAAYRREYNHKRSKNLPVGSRLAPFHKMPYADQ